MFMNCGYCDIRYANMTIFKKYLCRQHNVVLSETIVPKTESKIEVISDEEHEVVVAVNDIDDVNTDNLRIPILPVNKPLPLLGQPMVLIPNPNGELDYDLASIEQQMISVELHWMACMAMVSVRLWRAQEARKTTYRNHQLLLWEKIVENQREIATQRQSHTANKTKVCTKKTHGNSNRT